MSDLARVLRRTTAAAVMLIGLAASPAAAMEADTERPSVPSSRVIVTQIDGSVDLTWGAATDNVGVTEYSIYVDGPFRNVSPTNSFQVNGLEADRQYDVYVRASDAAGNVGFRSGTTTFRTNADVDLERPTVPGRPTLGDDGIIRWPAATDNVGVTKYILFAPTDNPRFEAPERLFETAGSEPEIRLPGGTYTFFIRAADAAGNIGFRTGIYTITAPPFGPDTTSPSIPSSGIRLDPDGRTIRWGGSTDDRGPISYEIYDADTAQVITTSPGNSYSFERGMARNVRLYVRAIDGAGNRSFRTGTFVGQIGDPDRPSIPGAIQYNRIEFGFIELAWAPSTDNIGVIGYRVYNADTRVVIDATVTTSIDILSEGPISIYVKAFDSAGKSHTELASALSPPVSQAEAFRAALGGTPITRLKARLNAASEPYPSEWAISMIEQLGS